MKGILKTVPFSQFLTHSKPQGKEDRLFFGLIAAVLLLAFLEFSQDYIKSVLHSSNFSITQSLSYKLFWLVFIPFTYLYVHLQNRYKLQLNNRKDLLKTSLLILGITGFHLLVFSMVLHLLSYGISDQPWPLAYLITQKLSTRLYLGLSIYIIFSVVYEVVRHHNRNEKVQEGKSNPLLVKSGKHTIRVEMDHIYWIAADGPYLDVHTSEKKYVILDSLKHILQTLPDNFKRIHKSTIVNIDQISSSKSRGNGDYDLLLKCGETVRLSRNYAQPLKGVLH